MILVLSPHLDDAVLSCPAFLQRCAPEALIATFFSKGQPSSHYRRRRAEDRAAAQILGVAAIHLRMTDAPFREGGQYGFRSLIFGRTPDWRPAADVIKRLVVRHQPSLVIAPLAVGNHVDHRVIRAAALAAVPHRHLRFYEDRPYSFERELVDHALGKTPLDRQPAEFWQRYGEVTYVKSYLGRMRRSSLPRAWRDVPAFPIKLCLERATRPNRAELVRTLEAIGAYKSQVRELFRDDAELESLYRNCPERLYRLASSN